MKAATRVARVRAKVMEGERVRVKGRGVGVGGSTPGETPEVGEEVGEEEEEEEEVVAVARTDRGPPRRQVGARARAGVGAGAGGGRGRLAATFVPVGAGAPVVDDGRGVVNMEKDRLDIVCKK